MRYGKLDEDLILERTRQIGNEIIEGKGSTEFGIGAALADMVKCILRDEHRVLPASVLLQGEYGQQDLHAGVPCKEVYQAAYDVLAAEDKAQYFRHSLGHGVGLEIHEGYNASPRSGDVYQTGNVTSMEPGIYLPDKFGIRIEDVLYLSPHGRENLSNVTKKLIVL